jgi:hypothetical protein
MRTLVCTAIVALFPFTTAIADDKAGEQGCTPKGTWVGTFEGVPVMTITYGHESAQTGTLIIDLPSFDPTFGGQMAGVKSSSAARGIWKKTGGNTWFYTALIIGAAPNGATVYVAKISGPVEATNRCTSITISTMLDVFHPNGDPWFSMPLADHGGHPMMVTIP